MRAICQATFQMMRYTILVAPDIVFTETEDFKRLFNSFMTQVFII